MAEWADDLQDIAFRNMSIADYAALMRLWRDCEGLSLRSADSREGVERYLARNPGLSFVAENDREVVGSLMAGHDGKRGYIQHLAVAEAQRGRGIAGRLVSLCLAALKSAGIEKSHVHVLQANATGLDYWSGQGWQRRSEVVMFSFVNGEDANA